MAIQSNSMKPIQRTFISDLPPETISKICSHLKMFDFFRFQSSSKQFQKSELYNGSNYEGLQSEFDFLLESGECPNADEILANIIKRGGAVKMNIIHESYDLIGTRSWKRIFMRSYFKLFKALQVRNMIGNEERNIVLAFAAYFGCVKFCKLFLRLGADVNYVDTYGDSVLCNACYSGELHVVKLIVNSGANVNFRKANGLTPLSIAMSEEMFSVEKTASDLLDSGSDHTLANRYGYTCLHDSIRLSDLHLYKRLLDMGVDSSLRNSNGNTAIELLVTFERRRLSEKYGSRSVEMIMLLFKWYKQLSPEDLLLNERKLIEMCINITEAGKLIIARS